MQDSLSHSFTLDTTLANQGVDSTAFQEVEEKPVVSLFSDHQLAVENHLEAIERNELQSGISFLLLMVFVGWVVYIQRNSDNLFQMVFRVSFDRNLAAQEARIENSKRSRNILLLLLVSLLSISLFVAGFLKFYVDLNSTIVSLFLTSLSAIVGFVVIKKAILWLLSALFNLRNELRMYHFNLNVLLSVVGLISVPLNFLLFFSPQISTYSIAWLIGIIGSFFYLKSLQRGLQIAVASGGINLLHLFYYLCALEILPVFILIRVVKML